MREKKKKRVAKIWFIALAHLVMSNIFTSVLAGIVGFFILRYIINIDNATIGSILPQYVQTGGELILMWIGVKFSADLIKENFVIDEPKRVVALATKYKIILFIISVIVLLFYIIFNTSNILGIIQTVDIVELILGKIIGLVSIVIFYYASRTHFSKT